MDDETTKPRPRPGGRGARPAATPGPNRSLLLVLHGPNVGKAIELFPRAIRPGQSAEDARHYLVGSDPACNLHIPQEEVEARHARFVDDDGPVRLEDLGSRTGTWVNDAPAGDGALQAGDEVRIGRNMFRFLGGPELDAALARELQRLQTQDSLTGLLNRRYFEDTLDREVQRCKRYGRDLVLLLGGLDEWDRIRIVLGGLGSDLLIRRVARLLREELRQDDSAARMGAEGFGVLLPEVGMDAAHKVANGLRQAVRNLSLAEFGPAAERITLSLSVGLAALGEEADDGAGLIREAQAELLNARQDGGDQTSGGGTWGR